VTQSVAVLIIGFPKRASDGLVICALAGPPDNIDSFSSHLHATLISPRLLYVGCQEYPAYHHIGRLIASSCRLPWDQLFSRFYGVSCPWQPAGFDWDQLFSRTYGPSCPLWDQLDIRTYGVRCPYYLSGLQCDLLDGTTVAC
jgi:hypothetical protein